jgi:hypothetical protein
MTYLMSPVGLADELGFLDLVEGNEPGSHVEALLAGLGRAEVFSALDDRDPGAVTAEGLPEFTGDVAAADRDQVLRNAGELHQALVREIRNPVQPLDRRDERPHPGRDHDRLRPEGAIAYGDLVLGDEKAGAPVRALVDRRDPLARVHRSARHQRADLPGTDHDRIYILCHGVPLRRGATRSGSSLRANGAYS